MPGPETVYPRADAPGGGVTSPSTTPAPQNDTIQYWLGVYEEARKRLAANNSDEEARRAFQNAIAQIARLKAPPSPTVYQPTESGYEQVTDPSKVQSVPELPPRPGYVAFDVGGTPIYIREEVLLHAGLRPDMVNDENFMNLMVQGLGERVKGLEAWLAAEEPNQRLRPDYPQWRQGYVNEINKLREEQAAAATIRDARKEQEQTRETLRRAFYGPDQVAAPGEHPLLNVARLYDVDIPTPESMATRFGALPTDAQGVILSAYNRRGITPSEFSRRIRAVTPVALGRSTFGYG